MNIIAGVVVGVLYALGIAVTGAGLRGNQGQTEGVLGALYRILGGGLIAGLGTFFLWTWLL